MSFDVLLGWEPRTRYVPAEGMTRGRAKALVAWEDALAFTDLRCRLVHLHEREITEEEACGIWMDDWWPGCTAWIGCSPDADGAVAWWEVTWSERAAA